MSDRSEIRKLLDETIARSIVAIAGEWHLDGEGARSFATFRSAFPWTSPERLRESEHGFAADLALELHWQAGPEAPIELICAADAGRVHYDDADTTASLTIHLNLFTDPLILLRPRTPAGAFRSGRRVSWPQAVRANRERLTASLKAWERAAAGEIVDWASDWAPDGIERYGFAANANVRP